MSDATPRARSQEKYTDAQIVAAIIKHKGNMVRAADDLGCQRSTIYRRMDKEPSIREVYDDIVEGIADQIEQNYIDEALDRNNPQWLKASGEWMRAHGRNRGYGDRLELAGDKDAPMTFSFVPYSGDDAAH